MTENKSPQMRLLLAIEETRRIAKAVAVSGTPAYVVGEHVVAGAVGFDKSTEAIRSARK